ncbi:MAG: urea ABC transporter ATP-binding subunit UrtE [Pseudomonadota bacterium]
MLQIRDLCLHYEQSQILYDISLEAETGKVSCVMGTNGVGKTSLLKAIAGTHPRSSGSLSLSGEEIGKVPAQVMARKGLAYVPQGRDIFPLLTVKENLETGFACLPKSEWRIPTEIFELFPVLDEMQTRRGGDLSGGQQQQLSIARALITKPKLLLLDEPTEGIQPNIIQQIGKVISYLRDQGEMAIILVEQYFDFAYDLADQFYIMKRGAVDLSGAKSALQKDDLRSKVSV